jgi:hypothetical protein
VRKVPVARELSTTEERHQDQRCLSSGEGVGFRDNFCLRCSTIRKKL